jgi:hypothetical protein
MAIIAVTVVGAIAGSVLLATRYSGATETTRGVTASVPVPGHPGPVAAGPGTLWVALNGDPRRPVVDRPLLRVDSATGAVARTVHLPGGGEASFLARVGERLIASVRPVGDTGLGPRRLVALDWRTGEVLALSAGHIDDALTREFDGPVDHVVHVGHALWALEVQPGRLLRLDASTLAPSSAPLPLSRGRTPGLAFADGYLWVTAADAGEILRIDPATKAITHIHVGGFPVGIVVANESVWFADRSGGNIIRLDPGTREPIGDPIHVGAKPTWLAVVGDVLFVTDGDSGTITRIDTHSGRRVGLPIRIASSDRDGVAPAVASAGQSVWASSFASNTVTRITSPAALTVTSREVTLVGTGNGPLYPGPTGNGVADGGIASIGHFTAAGGVNDSGSYTEYRSLRDGIARVRAVVVGKNGTIVFVIRIDIYTSRSAWTITSATKSYAGLHGSGKLTVDNFQGIPYTFVMKGTVSR